MTPHISNVIIPEPVADAARLLNSGVEKVFAYDNIAIVILMLCLCFSGFFNILQWWTNNRDKKEFFAGFKEILAALSSVNLAVTILNERIGHSSSKPDYHKKEGE